MNLLKQAYCRIVQTAFHLALPVLPYRKPETLSAIDQLPAYLKRKELSSVLLVTDPLLRKNGITAPLEQLLKSIGITCAVYDRTRANPTDQNVEEARALYLQADCQGLIAFGGGSSIDCAKALGARLAYPKRSLNQLKGNLRIFRKLPTLIAIPTTAGTGSEVTLTAVITDAATRHKYTMNSFPLIPACAVLDPEMTVTLPPSLTATTGMDALTHAVEAYIGRSTSRETRAEALEAVRLIFGNLETAYAHGSDREARANMLRAAYLAGDAFSKSYVGYVHAVAHSLGGQYNIPHGLANAVLLPIFLESYGEIIHKKLHQLAIAAGIARPEDDRRESAEKFIEAVRGMNRRMAIPETLSGIEKADIPKMARHADREANPLYPVPVLLDAKALEGYYNSVSDRRNDL